METEFNLNHLVSVTVNDLYKSRDYRYREESFYKDYFFSKPKKKESGVYYIGWNYEEFICSSEDFKTKKISKTHLLINNEVFEKAEVVLVFSNNDKKKLYFDTLEQAKLKAEEIKNTVTNLWI